MICTTFWSEGGHSGPVAIEKAALQLANSKDHDVYFVVEIKAVVRRKAGFDVE
jgi:hypothetical protein